MPPLLVSASGLIGATITVAATTIDDSIWLLSYIVSRDDGSVHENEDRLQWSKTARICHGLVFLGTLEFLAILSVIVAWFIERSATAASIDTHDIDNDKNNNDDSVSILLGIIAALLCWILAAFFFIKKMLKRRRKLQQQESQLPLATTGSRQHQYGTVTTENKPLRDKSPQGTSPKSASLSSVSTVISLTTVGALDELSYFPALLVGGIFRPLEICLGTLIAALFILGTISCCLSKSKWLVDLLDRIPIYAVIAVFAMVLTAQVLYELIQS